MRQQRFPSFEGELGKSQQPAVFKDRPFGLGKGFVE
jgi:hypothetical protein